MTQDRKQNMLGEQTSRPKPEGSAATRQAETARLRELGACRRNTKSTKRDTTCSGRERIIHHMLCQEIAFWYFSDSLLARIIHVLHELPTPCNANHASKCFHE